MNEQIIPIYYDPELGLYTIKIMPDMLKIMQDVIREGSKNFGVKIRFKYIPEKAL